MTCIAGVTDGAAVWIGGDSAGVAGWSLTVRRDPKVFRVGPFLVGYTTSFRMGQLLAYAFTPPTPKIDQDTFAFMVADFVPAVRRCFESGGWAGLKEGKNEGGQFLVGYRGRLFEVSDDFQVAESAADFNAVGCGADQAKGALYALSQTPPEERVRTALMAAEALSIGVRGPFVVETAT